MKRRLAVLTLMMLVSGATAGAVQARQDADLRGTWEARYDGGDALYIRLRDDDHDLTTGADLPFGDFQGLDLAAVRSSRDAEFRLVRPAGTLAFEGRFDGGRGRGAYRFTVDPGFERDLGTRGFRDLGARRMLVLAMQGVDLAFVDDLLAMDLGSLGTEDLMKAAIFDVTPAFADEMRRLGLREVNLEELVRLRIFDVDAGLVAEFEALGFPGLTVDDLIKVQVHDVDPDFVRSIRALGYDPSLEELVRLRIFDVDAAFIKEMADIER